MFPSIALMAALTGCTASQVEGVWMLFLDPAPELECQDVVSHNFINATTLDADSGDGIDPWTEDGSEARSGSVSFAQITYTGDGEALLVMGGQAFPGRETDGGPWIFDWEGMEQQRDSLSHAQGYDYAESNEATSTTALTLTFEKGTASGTLTESSTSLKTWTESDNWNDNLIGLGAGQIPADAWLKVVNLINDDETPASNTPISEDCTSEPCSLTVSSVCDSQRAVAATRTGYEDEDAYDLLENYGQSEGAARPAP